MKDLIRLTDLQEKEIYEIFHIADEIGSGKYVISLMEKVLFYFSRLQVLERG